MNILRNNFPMLDPLSLEYVYTVWYGNMISNNKLILMSFKYAMMNSKQE